MLLTRRCRSNLRLGFLAIFVFSSITLIEHVLIILKTTPPSGHHYYDSRNDNELSNTVKPKQSALHLDGKQVLNYGDSSKAKIEQNLMDMLKLLPSRDVHEKVRLQAYNNMKTQQKLKQDKPRDKLLLKPEDIASLEITFYRKRNEMVNQFNHTYVELPSVHCEGEVFIVVLVDSKPDYRERRSAIRRTWATVKYGRWANGANIEHNIVVYFLLGQTNNSELNAVISNEKSLYRDLIIGDFVDSYKNMTLKSLLGLKFVSEYCSHAQYILKSDDDMFINIPKLIDILTQEPMSRGIMGPYNHASKVYRRGKWSLTKEQFPFDFYPPYESGSAYVISVDIVQELYNTSHYVPWLFIDDVYITGILGKVINVTHVVKPGMFAFWTDRTPHSCDLVISPKVSITKSSPKVMDTLWEGVQTEVDSKVIKFCEERAAKQKAIDWERVDRAARARANRFKAKTN